MSILRPLRKYQRRGQRAMISARLAAISSEGKRAVFKRQLKGLNGSDEFCRAGLVDLLPQTVGIEPERLNFLVGSGQTELLAIERDIEGSGISGLDDDLIACPYGFFRRRRQRALHDLFSIRTDGYPGIFMRGYLDEEGAGIRRRS